MKFLLTHKSPQKLNKKWRIIMKFAMQFKDARFYQWNCEEAHFLTAKEKKMFDIAWIDDRLYINSTITGMPTEFVLLCASFDGVEHCIDKEDLYVPVDWVEKQYPNLQKAMKHCRKKSEQIRYEKI